MTMNKQPEGPTTQDDDTQAIWHWQDEGQLIGGGDDAVLILNKKAHPGALLSYALGRLQRIDAMALLIHSRVQDVAEDGGEIATALGHLQAIAQEAHAMALAALKQMQEARHEQR